MNDSGDVIGPSDGQAGLTELRRYDPDPRRRILHGLVRRSYLAPGRRTVAYQAIPLRHSPGPSRCGSPAFRYADEPESLTTAFTGELRALQYTFRKLITTGPQEAQALGLRYTEAPPASVWYGRQCPPRQTVSP